MPGRKKKVEKIEKLTKVKSREIFTLDFLPDELLLHILSYLSLTELLPLTLINKRFKALSQDDTLWENFIRQHFSYAQKRILERPNRRKAFKKQFNTAFDRRFFPNLQDKQQILNAFEGKIVNIFASDEDSNTIGALLATALANQPIGLRFDLQGNNLRLSDADLGLALACAARNENLEQLGKIGEVLLKSPDHLKLIPVIQKLLVHGGNQEMILHLGQKIDFFFNLEMIEQLLAHSGITATVKKMLENLTKRRPDYFETTPKLCSVKLYSQEAARENQYIEISSLEINPSNPIRRDVARLAPLDRSSKRITDCSEMNTLKRTNVPQQRRIANIAIQKGYVDLFQKLLDLEYELNENDFNLLGLSRSKQKEFCKRHAKKLFMQGMVDKAFMLAVKNNDKKNLTHILKHHHVSPLIRGKSFIHAVTSSSLKLLSILLGENGDGVEKPYFDLALELADEEVITYLLEHYRFLLPFELLRKNQGFLNAIISKVSDRFTHNLASSKEDADSISSSQIERLVYFFDTVMNNDAAAEDFNNPTQLLNTFQQYAQKYKIPPSKLSKPAPSKDASALPKRKRM